MKNKFEILEKERVYDGYFKMLKYRLKHSLFKGGESEPFTRELLERGHAVAVLLHDPKRDEIVLVEQFRIGAIASDNPWLVELVAGMIEPGEQAEEVARREAEEECGAILSNLHFIADYYSTVGACSETTTLYYSQIDARQVGGIHGLDSENEDIRVVKMSTSKFIDKVRGNEFRSGSIVAAGFWFIQSEF